MAAQHFYFLLFCLLQVILASEFGGSYQRSGTSCISENPWTSSCSCPANFYPSCFRATAKGTQTDICFCETTTAIAGGGHYGGAFQIDDDVPSGAGCSSINSFSGSCSCPSGYQPSKIRVQVGTKRVGEVIGSHIVVCMANNNGIGNFYGVHQTSSVSNECLSKNQFTDDCVCPVDACAAVLRATIDGDVASNIIVCSSSSLAAPTPSTVDKKVLFGYQGWFSTPVDKSVGWFHWSQGSTIPSGSKCNFDVWPDLSEFAASELSPTAMHYSNGQTAGLYLASNPLTINRHFSWMQTYGLDGILLQRFVNEIASPADPHGQMRNNVTKAVIQASASTGRVWAIEYDTSGAEPGTILNVLQTDWRMLVNDIGILKSSQYLHQDGKPVVALWGFGFTGNNNNQSSCLNVINWFKSQGVYVMGGVPYWWRTQTSDSQPNFLNVYQAYDLVMPWAVGRYGDQSSFNNLYNTVASPDITYAQNNKIGYAPIIFPGFSWANMHNNPSIFNQIPRAGGTFFNMQANTYANHAGVTFIKIAMFDEVDEGTAMFKAAATKADTPSDGTFIYLGLDGTAMPSDQYLRYAGALTAKNGG